MSDDVNALLQQLDGSWAIAAPSPKAEPLPAEPAVVDIKPAIDMPKHIKDFENVSGEILGSWRADREEAQSAINMLRDMIEDTITKGGTPTGTWLEAYVGAIKAKADTNATATKLLDAKLKLMQLAKPNVKVTQNNNTTTYNNLSAILADPVRDDDV